jgi:hypothetical protein
MRVIVLGSLFLLLAPTPCRPQDAAQAGRPSQSATRQTGNDHRNLHLFAVGRFGYGWFDADRSFDAVLGGHGGLWVGGGGELRWKRLFAAVSVERFSRTGQRVFLFEGEVFGLGIPDTLTITPFAFTGGYRHPLPWMTPYAGAGIGRYAIREESAFADDLENVRKGARSLIVLGGAERKITRLLTAGVELQYAHVPDAFVGGIAGLFGERTLSGPSLRLKVLFGR